MRKHKKEKNFTISLLQWNKNKNNRKLPWKNTQSPYFIWLSEIILQQTRVEQGLPYFEKFTKQYPTVFDLADATEDEVLKIWQGLGYYARAINLHTTAKKIAFEMNGEFPNTFEELKKLKGVGNYTAAAIASFAFNEVQAVVDGNVIRVLARYFGIKTTFDTTAGKKEFSLLSNQLISQKNPDIYNQAIMDFGAMVCTPQKPACTSCPLSKNCWAFQHQEVEKLPVRAKKIKKKQRNFLFLVATDGKGIFIQKQSKSDVWKRLYLLPLIEFENKELRNFKSLIATSFKLPEVQLKTIENYRQTLTHQQLHIHFAVLKWHPSIQTKFEAQFTWVALDKLHKYAFPKTIVLYLQKNGLL